MTSEYARKLKKLLLEHGCEFVRQGKGSHEIWKASNGETLVIPSNCKSRQLANKILKQAGIDHHL